MKYVVQLNEQRKTVSIEPDGVRYESETPVQAELSEIEASPVRMTKLGTNVYRVVAEKRQGRGRYTLWVDGYRFETEALDERTRMIRDISAATAAPAGPAPIVAPMPGLIVRVSVVVGDKVEAGQGVVVMEAMKMENELRASHAGTVSQVAATEGTKVDGGALLIVIRPT